MIDCIVIGYHESDPDEEHFPLALEMPVDELPAPLRTMRRTRVGVDGVHRAYLDMLTALRRDAVPDSGLYTVSELPNLATLYLTHHLRRHGRTAEFVNSFTYERAKLAGLLAEGARTVAITTTFYMAPAPVIDIVRFVRAHDPEVRIVVGGPLVDNQHRQGDRTTLERFFERVGADLYVWNSEGESTLHAIVAAVADGGDPASVPNVYARDGSSWSLSRLRPEVNDLNENSVDWLAFDAEELGPTLSTRTARSCAFSCAFCDYPQRAGALTLADVETVEHELEALVARGVRRVAFIDDTFNVPMRRFKELCAMMARRDFGIEWFSYFRCGHARKPEVYDLMYDAGCRGVLLGIESGDDQVLKNMDKRATTADYRYGIEQLRSRGIFVHASFVVGFPGESPETVARTTTLLNDSGPDTFAVNHWYYMHNTPVHQRAAEFGLSGEGHMWSHATMDHEQALEAEDALFNDVHAASWMPVNGLDFWGVPYLMGKGLAGGDIRRFLDLAKPLTPAAQGRSGPPTRAQEDELRAFCHTAPLEPARYER